MSKNTPQHHITIYQRLGWLGTQNQKIFNQAEPVIYKNKKWLAFFLNDMIHIKIDVY